MPDDPNEDGTEQAADETDIGELRKAANRSGKLSKENAELKRELAFRDAKVDLTNPMATFFKENYAGELDPEVIVAEAVKMGLPIIGSQASTSESAPPPEGEAFSPEERGSSSERSALNSGASQDDGRTVTPHPHVAAANAVKQAFQDGSTEEDALALGVDVIMRAAASGDTRATWDPNRS